MNKRTRPYIIASFIMVILITGLVVWVFKPVQFDERIKYELELLKVTIEKANEENLILKENITKYETANDSLKNELKKSRNQNWVNKKKYEELSNRKPTDAFVDSLLRARQHNNR